MKLFIEIMFTLFIVILLSLFVGYKIIELVLCLSSILLLVMIILGIIEYFSDDKW